MKTRKQVLQYQKKLKNNPTKSEVIAYEVLKQNGLLEGVDFLFQEIFGFYILDFVFPAKRLIIELDGYSHTQTKNYDLKRDSFCEKHGFTTVRLPNRYCYDIYDIYVSYLVVTKQKWKTLKKSAEEEYFNTTLTYKRKPPQKYNRKK